MWKYFNGVIGARLDSMVQFSVLQIELGAVSKKVVMFTSC